jgi:hypothetical protein
VSCEEEEEEEERFLFRAVEKQKDVSGGCVLWLLPMNTFRYAASFIAGKLLLLLCF